MDRLQKIMSNFGYCSRRRAEDLIKQGKVMVNGKKITIGDKADAEKDEISVDGKILKGQKKLYLMLNKPKGYLVTLGNSKSEQDKKTIAKLVKVKERVFPVGRLDYNTEGFLIMTNDGDFANKIMHPRYNLRKTYEVVLDKKMTGRDQEMLKRGIMIDDKEAVPDSVEVDGEKLILVIHEGRNRIVRRILKAMGYLVQSLTRTHIGSIKMDVQSGKWRKLRPGEVAKLIEDHT